jgi:hypothetical protein
MDDQAQVTTPGGIGGVPPMGGEVPQSTPELTINDLANLRAIVDAAVRRGAFAAAEITSVGATFDKLNAFLNVVAPPQTAESAPTTDASPAPAQDGNGF